MGSAMVRRRLTFEPILAPAGKSFFCASFGYSSHFNFSWHQHPELELALVTKGRGRRYIGDSIADFDHGDFVLVGPDVPHTWHSDPADGPTASAVIQFLPEVFGGLLATAPELKAIEDLLRRADRGLLIAGKTRAAARPIFTRILDGQGWRQVADLITLLGMIAESDEVTALANAAPRRADTVAGRASANATIDRVFAALHGPPDEIPDAAAMARTLRMSPAAFSRFFRRTVGKTYVACVNEIRVLAACRELIETDRPVIDIAFAAGFQNLSNFNRRFRALKGMTPRDFRTERQRAEVMDR